MEALDAFSEVFKPPSQIVEKTVDCRWTFAVNHCPAEVRSDDEPPVRLGERIDTIPICGVLGLYEPDTQQITIFSKGVARAAQVLGCQPDHLRLVVRIHECAHALLHVGLTKDDRLRVTENGSVWRESLKQATNWFKSLDPELHERLAQLLTYHGLRSVETDAQLTRAKATLARIVSAFEDLASRSPSEYRIDQYKNLPKERLISSINLLKNSTLIGAPAWHTVITW